jgi:hypothetical protein
MALHRAAVAVAILLIGSSADHGLADQLAASSSSQGVFETPKESPITVRPFTLGALADTLAGRMVRLSQARVVGVFDPRVFLVDSQARLRPLVDRNRVLVFIETGTLRVEPALLVSSTVTVSGVARTLLGMQVTREVPWPPTLTREAAERLDIRAAILARSVRTPEGIDLLTPAAPKPARR